MSVSILEVLQNAKYNIIENKFVPIARAIGEGQLKNAVILLEKGYGLEEDFDTVMNHHSKVEDVPEKEEVK